MTSRTGRVLCLGARGLSVKNETERSKSLIRFFAAPFEQAHQLIFPESSNGVTAVTAGFVAQRNQHCAALWHPLDLSLKDSEVGRIDQIVSRVNRQQRRTNFLKVGSGIVIV